MLILTRRIGETIVIGENMDITVTVLNVNGQQVKLGVNAPKYVPVHREEIAQRIEDEKYGIEPIIFESEPCTAQEKIYC